MVPNAMHMYGTCREASTCAALITHEQASSLQYLLRFVIVSTCGFPRCHGGFRNITILCFVALVMFMVSLWLILKTEPIQMHETIIVYHC